MENFLPGRFRLRIFSLGAGGAVAAASARLADATAATAVIAAALPPAMTEKEQQASQPL